MLCTVGSLAPTLPSSVGSISDVLLHLAAYAYLGGTLSVAHLPGSSGLAAVLLFAYGALIEVLQTFTGRFMDASDLLMNGLGIATGIAVARLLIPVLRATGWYASARSS